MVSWLVGCVLVGWLLVYNGMRIGGSTPAGAAWVSLGIGAVIGVVVFALGLLVSRRLAASGRVVHRGPIEIPGPSELEPAQRDALRLAWPPLGALAVVALLLGLYLVGDYLATNSDDRALTTLILGIWDVLVALWVGDEAIRLRRGEADGIDSVTLGCGLTAVLAGVGLSRDLAEPAQVVLIVLAGVAGAATSLAVWRLQGARGWPLGAALMVVVAALSLILPLTT
jgi:hypothetical protein